MSIPPSEYKTLCQKTESGVCAGMFTSCIATSHQQISPKGWKERMRVSSKKLFHIAYLALYNEGHIVSGIIFSAENSLNISMWIGVLIFIWKWNDVFLKLMLYKYFVQNYFVINGQKIYDCIMQSQNQNKYTYVFTTQL